MDNLTHTLIGLNMAQAGLSRRYGKGTALIMAVASNLPDLDGVAMLYPHWDAILYRRLFTHSVIGLPILALAGGFVFSRVYRRFTFGGAAALCLLAMAAHVFFDWINSFGVVFLYPFSMRRFELAWVFIIDLVLWALLLAPWAAGLIKRTRPRLETACRLSLTAVVGYVVL